MSRFPPSWLRIAFALSAIFLPSAQPSLAAPAAAKPDARPLFCAYGSVGLIPIPRPPGFESQFAVIVVEINSLRETPNVAISHFAFFDQAGKATKFKRVVKVEEFDEPRTVNEGKFAYYLNTASGSGTHSWNGTLPAGRIRLRIRVALADAPIAPVRFRLKIGRRVIEGLVDGSWPT
jgi:hypothetical protein